MSAFLFDLLRLALGTVLLVAGASKLLSPQPMATALGEVTGRTGIRWAPAVRGVAVLELAAALLIAGPWRTPLGPVLVAAVGLGISAFAGLALARRKRVSCGCFGSAAGRTLGTANVLIGLALAAGAGLVPLAPTGPRWLLAATATVAVGTALIRQRGPLGRLFGRHFQSFSTMMKGADPSV